MAFENEIQRLNNFEILILISNNIVAIICQFYLNSLNDSKSCVTLSKKYKI